MGNLASINVNKGKLHACNVLLKRFHKLKKAKDHIGHARNSKGDDHPKVSDQKEVSRVKVVLTKKEAAQLISMCSRLGGEKSLAQILDELKNIKEANKINKACSFGSSHGGWRPRLESIPEEFYEEGMTEKCIRLERGEVLDLDSSHPVCNHVQLKKVST